MIKIRDFITNFYIINMVKYVCNYQFKVDVFSEEIYIWINIC
jgi:hypothetical protein